MKRKRKREFVEGKVQGMYIVCLHIYSYWGWATWECSSFSLIPSINVSWGVDSSVCTGQILYTRFSRITATNDCIIQTMWGWWLRDWDDITEGGFFFFFYSRKSHLISCIFFPFCFLPPNGFSRINFEYHTSV